MIAEAVKLPPAERFALIDELLHSLDRIDPDRDRIWIEEAERNYECQVQGLYPSCVIPGKAGNLWQSMR